MSADTTNALKELQQALAGEPDPETMRKACEEMDRIREETRQRIATINANMTTPVDAKKELEDAIERLVKGVRDPEIMRKACERMDKMREETRKRIGTVEVAVELVREFRDR